MKAIVEANGGKVSSSVSSKTAFILAGDKPGPEKIRKAEELGIKVVPEKDFYRMIGNPAAAGVKETEEDNFETDLFGGRI